MTAKDLLPFCSTDTGRIKIARPFTIDGFTYATNGKYLLRVPAVPDADGVGVTLDNINKVTTIDGRAPLDITGLSEWLTVGVIPCRTRRLVCESCSFNVDSEIDDNCPDCNGDGFVRDVLPEHKYVAAGNRALNPYLLHELSALPGLEVCAEVGGKLEPVYLRFDDGGVGCLMPFENVGDHPEEKILRLSR